MDEQEKFRPAEELVQANEKLSLEEKRRQITEKQLQELARRREAGELAPYDYEVNYIWYLQQMGEPVTRKDVQNHAILIRPEEFEALGFLEFINAAGEKMIIGFTDENFDLNNPLIIFPEELGEEVNK